MSQKFFEHLTKIKQQLSGKEPLIFLDYDGTLTPIVATPDLALISEDMHLTVYRLAEKYRVSIVSGRATDDVREKVKIDGIFYAGSHGFEIVEPDGTVEIIFWGSIRNGHEMYFSNSTLTYLNSSSYHY